MCVKLDYPHPWTTNHHNLHTFPFSRRISRSRKNFIFQKKKRKEKKNGNVLFYFLSKFIREKHQTCIRERFNFHGFRIYRETGIPRFEKFHVSANNYICRKRYVENSGIIDGFLRHVLRFLFNLTRFLRMRTNFLVKIP